MILNEFILDLLKIPKLEGALKGRVILALNEPQEPTGSYARIWVIGADHAARVSLASLLATASTNLTPTISRGN
jgi:hypothetical protein